MAERVIQTWLRTADPIANDLYSQATARFLQLANAFIAQVAADADALALEDVESERGFQARQQFYFTSLMHAASGGLLAWIIDHVAQRAFVERQVSRAASAYLARLLESNSHRVHNDFKDRTRESTVRWRPRFAPA